MSSRHLAADSCLPAMLCGANARRHFLKEKRGHGKKPCPPSESNKFYSRIQRHASHLRASNPPRTSLLAAPARTPAAPAPVAASIARHDGSAEAAGVARAPSPAWRNRLSPSPQHRSLCRLWQLYGNEILFRIQIVFPGFVDHPNLVAPGSLLVGESLINLP